MIRQYFIKNSDFQILLHISITRDYCKNARSDPPSHHFLRVGSRNMSSNKHPNCFTAFDLWPTHWESLRCKLKDPRYSSYYSGDRKEEDVSSRGMTFVRRNGQATSKLRGGWEHAALSAAAGAPMSGATLTIQREVKNEMPMSGERKSDLR